ncbi:hypothetical protein G3N94_32750 [Burkholderia sp. Ac-20353]|nr:hypothetical protein [Burkholderia sp. Ac-20353]
MTTCSGTTAASWGRQPTAKEMLHFIRASVESIRKDAANDRLADGAVIERRLSSLLRHALMTRSPYEIALVLGSAAERMLFPEHDVLEQSTAAVQKADQQALRDLVWAVRQHRSIRGGRHVRRFGIEVQ